MSESRDYAAVRMAYGKHNMKVYSFEPNEVDPDPIWVRLDGSGFYACGTLSLTAAQELCAGLSKAIMEHRS